MSYQAPEAERTIHVKMLTKKARGGSTNAGRNISDQRIAHYGFTDDQTFNIPSGVFPVNFPMNHINFDKVIKKSEDAVLNPFQWTSPGDQDIEVRCFLEITDVAGLSRHALHIRHKDETERDAGYSWKTVKEGSVLKMSVSSQIFVYKNDVILCGLSVKNTSASPQTLTLKAGQIEIVRI